LFKPSFWQLETTCALDAMHLNQALLRPLHNAGNGGRPKAGIVACAGYGANIGANKFRLCVIVAIAPIVLFAVSLVAPNTAFLFATILTIVPVIISIIAAILAPCIRNNKITVSKR